MHESSEVKYWSGLEVERAQEDIDFVTELTKTWKGNSGTELKPSKPQNATEYHI
jgi:hypothetical protein